MTGTFGEAFGRNYHGQKLQLFREGFVDEALCEGVNHVVGDSVTVITRPSPRFNVMCYKVEAGAFRVKLGTHSTIPNSAPSATTEGTSDEDDGTVKWDALDFIRSVPACETITVRGTTSGSILTYWFLPM